ncbi:uncharacterized protein LTR77_004900 [Saxophila tyrrhenica]|uniref:RBR-type E3 ubiquitin transferase n=1 Tax=Saxophila tyrrhenica TaxID=1690608 RepID=A0AAV9PEJ3_9PEZI|nr:hypothetical protein LTR77_004900 [Saxophila tyrrhenica]
MAPAAKKRKTARDAPKFLCLSCQTERTSSQFPDYNPSAECEHLIHTCKNCLKKWVEVQVECSAFVKKTAAEDGAGVDAAEGDERVRKGEVEEGKPNSLLFGIKCPHPDCKGVMRNVNVEMGATKKVYQKFAEIERKFIGDSTPGWRWCLDPSCEAGQVHKSTLSKQEQERQAAAKSPTKRTKKGKSKEAPVIVYEDNPAPIQADICTCHACGSQACVSCDRPWHEGETCDGYQIRIKDRMEEEDKALREIQSATKPCPGCAKRIQKNGGCPNMNCSQCDTNFCWNCASAYIRGRWCDCPHNRIPTHERAALGL